MPAGGRRAELRHGDALTRQRIAAAFAELAGFATKEAVACSFAGSFFLLLLVSGRIGIPGLARYDLLFLGALLIQAALIATGIETWREVAVLSAFHGLGMGLELYKTSPWVGSWHYPGPAVFRLGTVPLYSGFMYAAVASYMIQAWRLLQLRMTGFPPAWAAAGLCALIYANFFTNHVLPDGRWPIIAAVCFAFRRTFVHYVPLRRERRMPLVLAFALIGFFVWVAENAATYLGAWSYPNQAHGWAIVGPAKITSWALLVILSLIIVAGLKGAFPRRQGQSR